MKALVVSLLLALVLVGCPDTAMVTPTPNPDPTPVVVTPPPPTPDPPKADSITLGEDGGMTAILQTNLAPQPAKTLVCNGLGYWDNPDAWEATSKSPKIYNGLTWLSTNLYPDHNLVDDDQSAVNFEYVMWGAPTNGAQFVPRYVPCRLTDKGSTSDTLLWLSSENPYGLGVIMKYSLTPCGIDVAVEVTPGKEFPNFIKAQEALGSFKWADCSWVATMVASYMSSAVSREFHFYGQRLSKPLAGVDPIYSPQEVVGESGWQTLGEGTGYSFNTDFGSVARLEFVDLRGNPTPRYIPMVGANDFMFEMPELRYLEPIGYGLIHGNGQSDDSDLMSWCVMLHPENSAEADVRLQMYNYTGDTTRPAWDWSHVIYNPQVGTSYRYWASIRILPFISHEQTRQDLLGTLYPQFLASIPAPVS